MHNTHARTSNRPWHGAWLAMAAVLALALAACSGETALLPNEALVVVSEATSSEPIGGSEPTQSVTADTLEGHTVQGTIVIGLKSNRHVSSVDVYLNDRQQSGSPLASITQAPFTFALDTTMLMNGDHMLTAVSNGRNGRRGREFTNVVHAGFTVVNGPADVETPPATKPEPEPTPPGPEPTPPAPEPEPTPPAPEPTPPAPEPEPTPEPTPPPPPSDGPSFSDILWHADHGDGTLGQWTANGCGGPFNNGGATATASTTVARSGTHSAAMTISNVTSDQGARLFRWCEGRTADELFYSTWMYFPTAYVTTGGWWNVFQFKSKVSSSQNDPFFILNVSGSTAGTMRFYLYDWQQRRSHTQTAATVPVGRWVHLEVRYRSSSTTNGRITVWQDGVELFDVTGVRTRYANGDTQWSVNNYAAGINPDPATIYVDDATISRTRVGPTTDVAALLQAGSATAGN